MLLTAIAYSLPMAIGIALSPLPFAAVVTMLLSERPNNATAFFLGWITGILFIGGFVFLLPGLDTVRGEPTVLSGWLRLIAGGVLLVLAVWQWQQRSSPDDPIEESKALSKLDSITFGKTMIMGFILSAFNPKGLLLIFAGASAIDASMASPSQQAIALTLFAVVASLSVVIPIIGYALFPEQARTVLTNLNDWLVRNNTIVVTTLLVVFGVLIIGSGLPHI